jgi:Family of unknown function (DUF6502)
MNNAQLQRLEDDYSNILVAIFEIMLRGGVRTKDLLPICVRSIERSEHTSRSMGRCESGGLVTAALVLDAWHRDRRYLSRRGSPRPVRLLGPGPSVEALVRRQGVKEHASAVARRLKTLELIVRCGNSLYRPASDVAVVSARDPLVLQHAARALSTLLETVGQNVSGTRHPAPLIERFAEVPDLPRRYVKEFRTFTQAQGRTFLRTVNDWLESRRERRCSARERTQTVRAGIHTYAYVAQGRRVGQRSNSRSVRV